ncbi:hypothetical protein Q9295_09480 [Xinfangfangia sp. CPCC 101601]|uniref:Secreted protein n=1 Tax=Pseudogemmobacter lacusdianii TaxID=3069608 RepID=A0ABU0VXX0_9RHOB|nr:hypothetical protein [Xinfangfangia sp. CPCC 101601]MDQ2066605.1 hypothetical protein [Xinfangfangia sp. CPCC 101601]
MNRAGLAMMALLSGVTGPARAEDSLPDPAFFSGVYQRVGRDAAMPPGLLNDLVRIEPAAQGWGLVVRSCGAETADETDLPMPLQVSTFTEVRNILEPANEAGARYTLWAVTDGREEACAP